VNGTPSVFINGTLFSPAKIPTYEELKKGIDDAISGKMTGSPASPDAFLSSLVQRKASIRVWQSSRNWGRDDGHSPVLAFERPPAYHPPGGYPLDDEIIQSLFEPRGPIPGCTVRPQKFVTPFYHTQLAEAVEGAQVVISGVSSFGVHWFAETVGPYLQPGTPVLAVTKGLEDQPDGDLWTLAGGNNSLLPESSRGRISLNAIAGAMHLPRAGCPPPHVCGFLRRALIHPESSPPDVCHKLLPYLAFYGCDRCWKYAPP